jgi:hypothetical protein
MRAPTAVTQSLLSASRVLVFVGVLCAARGAAMAVCVGDCNGTGSVTINELILGVNIALGLRPITDCPAFDTDFSGSVSVAELIAAVNVALRG